MKHQPALRVRDRSGKPAGLSSGRVFTESRVVRVRALIPAPAATPSGSNARVVERMLIAATPSGSNATINTATLRLTPKGSQPLEKERPHAMTTLKGSQPEFRVRDRSGKPGAASSPRGLEADSPTALLLSAGTPKEVLSDVLCVMQDCEMPGTR